MDIIDIKTYMQSIGREARVASRLIAKAETAARNRALTQMAMAIKQDEQQLLAANTRDVENAKERELEAAMIDRLMLTPKSIASMAEGLLQIAALADPHPQTVCPTRISARSSAWTLGSRMTSQSAINSARVPIPPTSGRSSSSVTPKCSPYPCSRRIDERSPGLILRKCRG